MKTALVTGGNKGIGLEVCRQLAKAGFEVWLSARNEERGRKAVEQLQQEKLKVSLLVMDVADESSIRRAAEIFSSQAASLDVLVNNAGILQKDDLDILDVPLSLVEKTLRTNTTGPLLVVQAFRQLLKKDSRIINVSSGGGSLDDGPGGWSPVYCISKTALNALTLHLAYALQPEGIHVNAVCPGWVKTDMGGTGANREVGKGAETIVWLAQADVIPDGKFLRDKKVIPW